MQKTGFSNVKNSNGHVVYCIVWAFGLLYAKVAPQWWLWFGQDGQGHALLYAHQDGALTFPAATVLHEFIQWILLSPYYVLGLYVSLSNFQYYSHLCVVHSLCKKLSHV